MNFNDKVFIVCVELNSKNAKEKFEEVLKSIHMGNFTNIMDGVYAIKVPFMRTSESLRGEILTKFDSGILLIMKSSVDTAWRASFESDKWLKENI